MKMLRIIVASFLIAGVSGTSWADDVTYRKHQAIMAEKCSPAMGRSPILANSKDKAKFEAMPGPRWIPTPMCFFRLA
jgi:hypothetical protein